MQKRQMLIYRLLLSILIAFPWLSEARAEKPRLLVFAAASMRDAMEAIGSRFEDDCGCEVVFSFAATSTLARQVANGAPADVFISASTQWTEWLVQRLGLPPEQSRTFAGNSLVLVASGDKSDAGMDLLNTGRFAMADPYSVPAGIYGRQALQSMEIWDSVKANAVFAENVRLALQMVHRGDLAAGLVYKSDLVSSPGLVILHTFNSGSHDNINYTATVTGKNSNTTAGFLEFLNRPVSQELLAVNGFLPVNSSTHE